MRFNRQATTATATGATTAIMPCFDFLFLMLFLNSLTISSLFGPNRNNQWQTKRSNDSNENNHDNEPLARPTAWCDLARLSRWVLCQYYQYRPWPRQPACTVLTVRSVVVGRSVPLASRPALSRYTY
jgi:hypothetical protein